MTVCGTWGSTAVTCCTIVSISGERREEGEEEEDEGVNSEGGMIGPWGVHVWGGGGGSGFGGSVHVCSMCVITSVCGCSVCEDVRT